MELQTIGWPAVVYTELKYTGKTWESYEFDMDGRFRRVVSNHTNDISKEEGPNILNALVNVATTILILLIVGVICELSVRRREARKL